MYVYNFEKLSPAPELVPVIVTKGAGTHSVESCSAGLPLKYNFPPFFFFFLPILIGNTFRTLPVKIAMLHHPVMVLWAISLFRCILPSVFDCYPQDYCLVCSMSQSIIGYKNRAFNVKLQSVVWATPITRSALGLYVDNRVFDARRFGQYFHMKLLLPHCFLVVIELI